MRENLRYGRLEASDAEIEEAARLAGAHDFIVKLDKGYDTEVGEGGNLLSTGQKQLISLARAVLARPEVFIMDEATSLGGHRHRGADPAGHGDADGGAAPASSSPTASPPVKRADRILVIEDGRITEQGSARRAAARPRDTTIGSTRSSSGGNGR